MTVSDFIALFPVIALSALSVFLLLLIAFWRDYNVTFWCTSLGLAICLLTVVNASEVGPQQVTPLLLVDSFGLFFTRLILLSSLVICLLSGDYWRSRAGAQEEYFLLLVLGTLGAVILVLATHLASFMLGLELLGVSLYAMIAYPENNRPPLEAAIKYLVLSGAASAVLLFGFALLYAATGTLDFDALGAQLTTAIAGEKVLVLAGAAMIFAGLSFKLSVVPFHMWTPDVYQGAPAPVTAFLATVSKGAVFIALLRFYLMADLYQYQSLLSALSVLAIASMLGGNFLALMQNNVKRIIAYSSIAHFGYLLVALIAGGTVGGGELAAEAGSYYVVAYVVTSLALFAVIILCSHGMHSGEMDQLQQYTGLFWRQPLLAAVFTFALLSLAGIPLTVGFIGKFYLFTVGVASSLWLVLAALVLGSAIGIFYYIRIIYVMSKSPEEQFSSNKVVVPLVGKCVVVVLTVCVLWLGSYPQPLIDLVRAVALGIV